MERRRTTKKGGTKGVPFVPPCRALRERVTRYFSSCVITAGFGLPQPVTRSNAVPAE